jgi:hypothetical protein
LVGSLAACVCVAWIVWRFGRSGAWDRFIHSAHLVELIWRVVAMVPVYAAGLCLAALAWYFLQSSLLLGHAPLRSLFSVYATTQFAKYLPGNVGHFVGRHVLLRRLGLQHVALGLGTLSEAVLLIFAAAVWAAPAAPVLWPRLDLHIGGLSLLALEITVLALVVGGILAVRSRFPRLRQWLPLERPSQLIPVLPLQLGLFGLMSLALVVPAHVLAPDPDMLWLIPAAVAASWIAGFVVIGAPAGIGVREVVFLALLHGHLPEDDILLLAAAFRVITFGGDVVLLLVGLALGGTRRSSESAQVNGSGGNPPLPPRSA